MTNDIVSNYGLWNWYFFYFFLFKCSIRKWTGSNKLNSILVTRAFLIFTIWGWFELALWSIIWLTVYSLICKNNIFVVLDAFKVPPCIYIDMHLKGDKNTPKNPTSTKWNNILIRLEHAHRSLTTRSPLNRPLKLPLTATSLHQSLYQHQETAVFAQNGNKKRRWIIVGQIVGFRCRNTIWANNEMLNLNQKVLC